MDANLNGANPETAFLRITCARKITMSEKDTVILLPDQDQNLEVEAVELVNLIDGIVAFYSRGAVFMNIHLLLVINRVSKEPTVMEYGMAYLLLDRNGMRSLGASLEGSQLISINFNLHQQ